MEHTSHKLVIKNIIFDWSGVVKDCVLDYLVIANKMFTHFGAKEISLEELKREWRQPYMVFYGKYIPGITEEQQSVVYRKAIGESPAAKEYPGISNLIKEARASGKKIMVVSSDDSKTILPEIKSFGLEGAIDDVVFHVHDKEEAVDRMIKIHNLKKSETIIVGDSNHEIEVGKKLGIGTVAVTWGFTSEAQLRSHDPDYIVHNLEELKKVIL